MNSTASSFDSSRHRKKVLLSTVGSRGDVQPMLALAMALKQQGHQPILAAGPNFSSFVKSHGIDFATYGPDLTERKRWLYELNNSREKRQKDDAEYIKNAFESTYDVAKDCDMIVVGGAFHHAGRSVAQALDIPFVCALYCAASVSLLNYSLVWMQLRHQTQKQNRPRSVNIALWKSHEKEQDDRYLDVINIQRDKLNLAPIDNVHRHIISEQPWLVADKTLGPAAKSRNIKINQVGPLLLKNDEPLPSKVEAFLDNGPPPIYIGFGSMLYTGKLTRKNLIDVCRLSGHRAIISQGWSELDIPQDDENILAIADINQSKLFPRMAAIVHHGGAGTTTAAAIAGVPQLIVPNVFDQFYWGHRIEELGIGLACRNVLTISVDSLVGALQQLMTQQRAQRAMEVSQNINVHGTENAALLIEGMLS